jgi:hypothetical protein
MKTGTKVVRLGKASEIQAALEDLCLLLQLLGLQPMHIHELVVGMQYTMMQRQREPAGSGSH